MLNASNNPISLKHVPCNKPLGIETRCDACNEVVDPSKVSIADLSDVSTA